MRKLFFIPVVLSLLVLGTHFLRYGQYVGVAISLALTGLLFVRRAWAARTIQVALLLGAIEWAITLYELWQLRVAQGEPAARMAIILGAVATVTVISALLFQARPMREFYGLDREDQAPG